MKPRILIVEDDKSFRDALSAILARNYSVTAAENGKVAKSILSIQDVDLVISDIQMPFFTGVDLLEWIKQTKPCPVILMTGFSHLLEMKRADELGADDFLSKPFSDTELKEKIEKILGVLKPAENKEEVKPPEVDFFKVPIEDFVSQKETSCPVFIKLNNDKYIKIAHKGGKIPEEKINLFKDKGIAYLYVTKEDFPSFVGFTVQITKALAGNSNINAEKKNRFLKYTGELLSQQIFSPSFDQTSCQHAKDFLQSSLNIIAEDDETGSILMGLNDHTDFLYAHSLGVSAMSVLIAKKMGWESGAILFKLAFAGLFHDIGKKELPKSLLEKQRFQFTAEEVKLYESHTVRGKEILDSLKNAPSESVAVAYEHHESAVGNGYPRSVDHSKLHPFSKIVNVANVFCNYAIRSYPDQKILTAQEAISKMQTNKVFEIDKQAFQALISLIKKPSA
ncbi:MAG: HD domain-containing phosphohydrolase [Bdellovibrionota bacterium]